MTLKNGVYSIGCFEGTYDEAVEAITKKYEGQKALDYIKKLDDCKDMNWLTDEVHQKLKNSENWEVRGAVAEYSGKHYRGLRDYKVRADYEMNSDKSREELKDDVDYRVRMAVAQYSVKYHEQLKDGEDFRVRIAVAKYSDKYHEQLKDDEDWEVKRAVVRILRNF